MLSHPGQASESSQMQLPGPTSGHTDTYPDLKVRQTRMLQTMKSDSSTSSQQGEKWLSCQQPPGETLSQNRTRRRSNSSVGTNRLLPTRLSRPLPDPPPIEIPAPLRPRRKSTMGAQGMAGAPPREESVPAVARVTSGTMTCNHSDTSFSKTLDTSTKKGFSDRNRVKDTLRSKQLTKLQVEATVFSKRALPATPESAAPTPYEVWQPRHRHGRSASSEKILPLPPLQRLQDSMLWPSPNAEITVTIPQTPVPRTDLASLSRLADLPPDSAAYSPDRDPTDPTTRLARALRLRSGSVITLIPPEQTAWKPTAYYPGAIKLQKAGRLLTAPSSPSGLSSFNFNPDLAATTVDDIFKKILDDSSSTHTKRSEDTTLNDVAHYMETYGFEPVTFSGDEFWLDDETRSIRSRISSMASAELSSYYYQSKSPSVSSPAARTSSGMPERRLSHDVWPVQRHGSIQSTHISLSPTTPRYMPLSPASSQPLIRQESMTERERKVALKRMGASSPGVSHRVGFMRLLRGAGGIV